MVALWFRPAAIVSQGTLNSYYGSAKLYWCKHVPLKREIELAVAHLDLKQQVLKPTTGEQGCLERVLWCLILAVF